ncbi:hypothetical protein NM688_g8022 [Phlebia brevispora]|uniref:Uncharacterized protein n=1 Tax=Phlebia brevispora TaxID=194682 RepID=A0ACC1RYD3_9APHY|nr:hypothetical protein NM688_g8022 [Phlebia brevispora]
MSSSTTPQRPPLDRSLQVLPGFLDFQAEHNGDNPWVLFPSISGKGVDSISFAELARASHRVAHILRPHRQGQDGEVVAVLINCDTVLYVALILGMVRAGLVPFPMSPRNSAAAIVNMLDQTSATRIITHAPLSHLIDAVKKEVESKPYQLRVDELPDLYEIFPTLLGEPSEGLKEATFKPYPSPGQTPSWDEAVVYLHSSGSTGFPKAILQTHTTIFDWCKVPVMLSMREDGLRVGPMALPAFHTFGIYTQIYTPLVSGISVALFTPQAPASPVVPNPQVVLEVAKTVGCNILIAVPAFLEIWAQSDKAVKFLASLKAVQYSGGPLSSKSGTALVEAGVKLTGIYGTTEFGAPSNLNYATVTKRTDGNAPVENDWEYMSFFDDLKYRMVPEGDGSYELQILTSDSHHPSPAVENLLDTRGYATKDLFVPHPTKKGFWRISGRKDDVIVLGSGEKIVPIPQEGHITASDMVAGAVMFGRGRNQCGVLIEPHAHYAIDPENEAAAIEFRNKIWPVVEEANELAPAFGRIFKEMIIITDPAKPLPRAAKSTVIRKMALAAYEKEIEQLYFTIEGSADTKGVPPPPTWGAPDLEAWLLKLAGDIKGDTSILPNVDLFDQGFDSLHATFLRNKIIATLRSSEDPVVRQAASKVSQNFVFDFPTLHELAEGVSTVVLSDDSVKKDVAKEITTLLERYSADLTEYDVKSKTPANGVVVLLTGSTGNVGSHVLATLLKDSRINTVYTLNRGSCAAVASNEKRQFTAFEERGLPTALLSSKKLVQLFGDLSAHDFGLPEPTYNELAHTVTHVIHNAWKVDFNQSLKSFEPLIASTRHLINAPSAWGGIPLGALFRRSHCPTPTSQHYKGTVPRSTSSRT